MTGSPTIFDKFTADIWQQSIDETLETSKSIPTYYLSTSASLLRDVKRYFICQAKNMSDLVDGRPLEWYVEIKGYKKPHQNGIVRS